MTEPWDVDRRAGETMAMDDAAVPHDAQIHARVALPHDWLPLIGGAERVLEQLTLICPNSEIFTIFDFLSKEDRAIFGERPIHTSRLNSWPAVQRYYRSLLPLCIRAIERFDVSRFDAIVSSSASFAKGVISRPEQPHIAYIHSPARYAWDMMHEYLGQSGLDRGLRGAMAREILHNFRTWDARTANSVDQFVVNSQFVARRVWKFYRRRAKIVHPPVDVDAFALDRDKEDYYVSLSRLVGYKRVDLVVEAFRHMPEKKLVVIGDGPQMRSIKARAGGNVVFVGHAPRPDVIHLLQKARAFVSASLEDFGIAAVEAQACGTPVIALGHGGAAETILDQSPGHERSGVLFGSQTVADIVTAVRTFEDQSETITPDACRRNAERFRPEAFRAAMARIISAGLEQQSLERSAVYPVQAAG